MGETTITMKLPDGSETGPFTLDDLKKARAAIGRTPMKPDIAEAQKEVMAEARARGYDTRVMRRLIAMRKRDADDLAEEEAVLALYREALGM